MANAFTRNGNMSTFNLEPVLRQNILQNDYFKGLYELNTFYEVVDEIYNRCEYMCPWIPRTKVPSSGFCLLYKFFLMNLTKNQIGTLLKHKDSPFIRGIGFLYLRYLCPFAELYDWYENYIEDEEEIIVRPGQKAITIGQFCRDLLTEMKFCETVLPRIPLLVQKDIEPKLAKYAKPAAAPEPPARGGAAAAGMGGTSRPAPVVPSSAPPPAKAKSRSPARARSRSPARKRSRSRDRSRERHRSRSRERRHRSRSRDRKRSRSRDRRRSRSRSPRRHSRDRKRSRSRSRDKKRSGSKDRKRSRSRDRKRSHSRERKRSHSRERKRSRSRDRKRSRSRERKSSPSGDRKRSRSRDRSPAKDKKERSKSPRGKSPAADAAATTTSTTSAAPAASAAAAAPAAAAPAPLIPKAWTTSAGPKTINANAAALKAMYGSVSKPTKNLSSYGARAEGVEVVKLRPASATARYQNLIKGGD